MKKLIFRKILLDITFFFLIVAFSLSIIVWIIQAVNYLEFVSEDGHSLKVYFLYTLLNLPKMFSKILPFIIFVSVFHVIIRYERNNELIIFWTYGISKLEFINVIFKFSLLFVLIQCFLTAFILPMTQSKARSLIMSSNIDFFPQLLKEKKFIDTVSNLTIFIDNKSQTGELQNIFIKEKINDNSSQIIYSRTGSLRDDNNKQYLILKDGMFINQNNLKKTFFKFKETQFDLSKYASKTTKYPKIQERKTLTLFKCINIFALKNDTFFENEFTCNKDSITSVMEEAMSRLILPLYIPITLILSSLLILRSGESLNYTRFKSIIFFSALLIIIFSEIMTRYAGLTNLLTITIMLIPFVLMALIYLGILINLKKWENLQTLK